MTKDEALRLALEALEYTGLKWPQVEQAITAIKDALEAKDEPVACKECHLKDTVYDLLGDLKVANLKLSVRSQRTWVGLTAEERDGKRVLENGLLFNTAEAQVWEMAVEWAEQKLRERNT